MRKTLISMMGMDDAERAFQDSFTTFKNAYVEDHYLNCNTEDTVFLFRGGEDIHPSIYKEKRAPENGASMNMSPRDAFEIRAFDFAEEHNIPMVGVCRGSQFLCAKSGGKLVQHVSGHGCGEHIIITVDGAKMLATSTHHQMMYPWPVKHKLIAWSSPKRSNVYVMNITDRRDSLIAEPEIVYFNHTRALAIQGHPEYLTQQHPFTKYCNKLVSEYLQDIDTGDFEE